jgi:peptidoglycan/xylan/chitin deacetylase (PgdA/CDA1 family)
MSLKPFVLETLFRSGAFGLTRRLRRFRFAGATVLLYHHVVPDSAAAQHYAALMGDPTARQLEALIRYLKRSFRFCTAGECMDRWRKGQEVAPHTLILTFDDGYADLHDHLLPVLKRQAVPATVFLATGALGGRPLWSQRLIAALSNPGVDCLPALAGIGEMRLSTPAERVAAIEAVSRLQVSCRADEWEEVVCEVTEAARWDGTLGDERMMTWDDVKALASSGWVEFGGHTVRHPLLPNCEPARARWELESCAAELRDRLDLRFLPFAYPNGRANPDVQALVKEAGFDCAFTGQRALGTSATPRYQLGRRHVAPGSLPAASLALSGMR